MSFMYMYHVDSFVISSAMQAIPMGVWLNKLGSVAHQSVGKYPVYFLSPDGSSLTGGPELLHN